MQNSEQLNYENQWMALKAEEDRLMQIIPKNGPETKQKKKLCIENKRKMNFIEKQMRNLNLQENIEPFEISEKKKFQKIGLSEWLTEEQNILQIRPENIVFQSQITESVENCQKNIQNLKNQLNEFN